jgi:UDP-N-acetylmuramoyl-tripeptide--D-alanyl-D-alanine ligase
VSGRNFDTHVALAAALHADLRAGAPVSAAGTAGHALRVLVKGSRGSAMDRIVTALLARGDATDVA